jgi:hypothetical protein
MKYFEEGQTVYHHEYGQGGVTKISNCEYYPITVEFSSCTRTFTADGRQIYDGTITLSQTPITKVANIPIEEDAPFTFEDDLLGLQVISKDKSIKGVINYQDKYKIIIGNYQETYEQLLKDYIFIDGKPCGREV